MDRTNKIKAKATLFFALNAFLLGASASYGESIKVTQSDDLSDVLHEDKGLMKLIHRKDRADIQDAFVEDFLQGPSLNRRKKLELKEKIGQGGFGAVYKAEQDGQEYIIKQAVNKDAAEGMQDEYNRSLAIYGAADDFVRNPDAENVYGKLLGLGVIVPVIGATKGGGIVQAYANGENLDESATYVTENGLLIKMYSDLCKILRNGIKNDKNGKAMQMLDTHTTGRQNLTYDLFDKAMGRLQTSTKTLIRQHLLADDAIQTLVNSQKLDIDSNQIETLVKDIHTLHQNRRIDFFNEHGFPRSPQRAIQVLCSFFQALVTLHELGYAHCDLKPANVILTRDKIGQEDNTVLKLIDLGALTRIGERISAHSNNGAPESLNPAGIYNHQILTAQPSYDIYCSTGIILGCLFGYPGLQVDHENFWPKVGEDPLYIQRLKDPNFRNETDSRRFDFFSNMLQNLNTSMGQYGENYPDEVLNVIQTILSWVTEADRQLRPSAIDILERLQELALSDWNSGNFRIQISENQVPQKVQLSISKK